MGGGWWVMGGGWWVVGGGWWVVGGGWWERRGDTYDSHSNHCNVMHSRHEARRSRDGHHPMMHRSKYDAHLPSPLVQWEQDLSNHNVDDVDTDGAAYRHIHCDGEAVP